MMKKSKSQNNQQKVLLLLQNEVKKQRKVQFNYVRKKASNMTPRKLKPKVIRYTMQLT